MFFVAWFYLQLSHCVSRMVPFYAIFFFHFRSKLCHFCDILFVNLNLWSISKTWLPELLRCDVVATVVIATTCPLLCLMNFKQKTPNNDSTKTIKKNIFIKR